MRSLLLRARTDAFEVSTPMDVLDQNLIGGNSGNLLFLEAAQRLLTTREQAVTVDRFEIDPSSADQLSERYDAYVIPLANAFRPSYEATLIRMTQLIERLRIPVVVLGVGAQATVRHDARRMAPMAPSIRRFVAAVLDHGPTIGVRGEFTAEHLASLGFKDVEVIGCPSLFRSGNALRVTKRAVSLDPAAHVSINVSPYVAAMGPIVRHHLERYPGLTYTAQDLDSLERLLTGSAADDTSPDDPIPRHIGHPLYQRPGGVRFFVAPAPWVESLRTADFSFGSRIHGNIAAILAGTPAVVLAHDSRTLEIARWFSLPHRVLAEVPPDIDAAELYAEADFGPFHAALPDRFARFTDYLARHGLGHVFAEGEDPAAFPARVAETPYPPAVTVDQRRKPHGLADRLAQLRRRTRRAMRGQRMRRWRARLLRRTTRSPGAATTTD